MDAYFAKTRAANTTAVGGGGGAAAVDQISDEEHARRARESIAAQWNTAKKQETRRMLEEVRMADAAHGKHGLLAAHGLNDLVAGGVKLADGMTTETADVLLMQEPEWQKDVLSTHCNTCRREFSMTRRRHHCRACGMVVCNTCSQHRALLPLRFKARDTQRVCEPCHQKLEPVQDLLVRIKSLKNRKNAKYDPSQKYRGQMNSPIKHTLSGEIRKAAYSVHNLFRPTLGPDKGIPASLMKDAQGLVFITVFKAGFLASLRIGTGLVIARLPNGQWSAPSAIYTVGGGFGAQIGGGITDFVTVLTTRDAVRSFMGDGVGRVGASVGVAVGTGRTAQTDANINGKGEATGCYTYAHSRGLFAGVSLELGGIRTRHKVNRNFYGRVIHPTEILTGQEPPPIAAAPLYDELRSAAALFRTAKWGGGEGGAGHDSTAMSIPGLDVGGGGGGGGGGGNPSTGDAKHRSSLEDIPDFAEEDPDL
jgi:lipid-binding SYLF domain-containing protein